MLCSFEELVKRLVDEPDSSSAESNLLDFIDNLPVGVIPRATLVRINEVIMSLNSLAGIRLIEYGLRRK